MATRIAALRLQLIDSFSGPSRNATSAIRGLEGVLARLGKSGSPEVKRLVKDLDSLQRKSKSIGDFREARRGLKDTSIELKSARSNVQRLEQALRSATKPTAKMSSDLRTARSSLKLATAAFREQGGAVRATERALQQFGISSRTGISKSQQEIRNQLAQTIRRMRELDREARRSQPQRPASQGGSRQASAPRQRSQSNQPTANAVAAGAAGGYLVHRSRNVAQDAFIKSIEFNEAEAFRDALGYDVFNDDDKAKMNRQAERIGKDTKFTNADVIRAQVSLLQAGIRDAQSIMNTLDPVTDYALSMGVTLEEAAFTLRSSANIRKVNLKDTAAVNNFVDSLIWMAKNAGMDDNDVRQYIRYGGGSLKSMGISDETAAAMAIILKRAGTPGDEAGVFARTAAAKLGSPTGPGREALYAMGLRFDDYVTHPDAFKVEGLAALLRENFGKQLPEAIQKQITDFIENETYFDERTGEDLPVGSDRGAFTEGIIKLVQPVFGKLSALELREMAGAIGRFHKFSAESVDSEKLLMDILSKDPSVAQLNAFFTQRQGNRANMIAANYQDFIAAIKLMKETPDGIANTIGTKSHEGAYGDFTRAIGAIETALTRTARDWEFLTRPVLVAIDDVASEFAELDITTRRVIEGFAALAIVLGGFLAMRAGMGVLGRWFGTKGGPAAGAALGAGGKAGGTVAAGSTLSRILKGGGKALGPLAVAAATGLDVYDAANDAKLSQAEKSQRYTGAVTGAAGAVTGAKMGAAAGAFLGPLGSFVGGAAGGIGGYYGGDAVGSYLGGLLASKDPTRAAGDKLAMETTRWHVSAQEGMRAYIHALASGGEDAEAKAQVIADQIKEILSVEGNPTVNTANLERALALAREVAAVVGGGAAATPASGPTTAVVPLDGSRAKGGPVKKGGLYRVNEDGEELFSPGTDGTIIPHGATVSAGGRAAIHVSAPISISIQLHGSATEADGERLARLLEQRLARSSQTMFSGLKFGDA